LGWDFKEDQNGDPHQYLGQFKTIELLGLEGPPPALNTLYPICHMKVQVISPWVILIYWQCGSSSHL
jgi:hypothetical protein